MFLVSVPRIFKIAMKASCGETTSKVACEISAFYNFVRPTNYSLYMFLKFWKIPEITCAVGFLFTEAVVYKFSIE